MSGGKEEREGELHGQEGPLICVRLEGGGCETQLTQDVATNFQRGV